MAMLELYILDDAIENRSSIIFPRTLSFLFEDAVYESFVLLKQKTTAFEIIALIKNLPFANKFSCLLK